MLCVTSISISMQKTRRFPALSRKLWPNVRYADTLAAPPLSSFPMGKNSTPRKEAHRKVDLFSCFCLCGPLYFKIYLLRPFGEFFISINGVTTFVFDLDDCITIKYSDKNIIVWIGCICNTWLDH